MPNCSINVSLFFLSHSLPLSLSIVLSFVDLVLNASFGALYVDEGNVTIECRASSGIITSNVTWTTMNPDNLPASDIITSGMFGEVATYLNLRTPLTLVYQCSVDNATSPVAGVSLGKEDL